ncbi:MAG: hypothetical protein PHR77_08585 [Kiritimatiellae bacterium]|nr:hypothetical protein [Kiritimatiellia bacterium]MDD5519952.1 hypothetical protein [Kiritimatiellia bacterium]
MKLRNITGQQAVQLCAMAGIFLVSGCASLRLETARNNYEARQFGKAVEELTPIPKGNTDRVLFLMERGMAQQAACNYKASTRDWLDAMRAAETLDLYSVSGDTPSLLINDNVMPFRGAPYERVLLHTFAAKSYMAMGEMNDAAVEARNIVHLLENRDGFPDDPYSRYLAGLCFEITGDYESAAFQYRQISNMVHGATIEASGLIRSTSSPAPGKTPPAKTTELVCLIGLGTLRNSFQAEPAYVEVYMDDRCLGRSYKFTDVELLWEQTRARLQLRRETKKLLRIALKEWLLHEADKKNNDFAAALSILLYGLEIEDVRRWETLPTWLHIARIQCPPDLRSYRLVVRDVNGAVMEEQIIDKNVIKCGNTRISFSRGLNRNYAIGRNKQ